VHALRQRDERLLRVRPRVEVHHGVLADPPRNPVAVRDDALDPAVRQVVDVVELRHVDTAGRGQPGQQFHAAARATLRLPHLDDVGDLEHGLLAVAEHGGVHEIGDRLGIERGVTARDDHGMLVGAVPRLQRDAREVEGGEQVGVAQFGGEADAEKIERADRTVRVDGELREAVLPQKLLHVGPDRVRALRERVGPLVENLVEDHDALVGQADLVRVRVH
jgi:hypothetical protein